MVTHSAQAGFIGARWPPLDLLLPAGGALAECAMDSKAASSSHLHAEWSKDTFDLPNVTARTAVASLHSTTRMLYRPAAVSALLDTVRELAMTKTAPSGNTTSEAAICSTLERQHCQTACGAKSHGKESPCIAARHCLIHSLAADNR